MEDKDLKRLITSNLGYWKEKQRVSKFVSKHCVDQIDLWEEIYRRIYDGT